jgi:hypothetical protein
MNDYNRRLIEEFRAHGGKVGGMWEGTPLLLLTTRGATSGERRTTPMGYMPEGDRLNKLSTTPDNTYGERCLGNSLHT